MHKIQSHFPCSHLFKRFKLSKIHLITALNVSNNVNKPFVAKQTAQELLCFTLFRSTKTFDSIVEARFLQIVVLDSISKFHYSHTPIL